MTAKSKDRSVPRHPAEEETAKEPSEEGTVVTYTPRDPGDPHTVEWNGITFEANKPVMVADPETVEKARGNAWFSVEGQRATRTKPTREPVPPPGPGGGDEIDPAKMVAEDE